MSTDLFDRHQVVRTSDLEEAQAALGSVFLPLQLRLADARASASRSEVAFNAVRVGEVVVGYLRFGDDVHMSTVEAENYHLDMPVQGRSELRSGRAPWMRTSPGQAAVFMPGQSADIHWYRECGQLCLMFPRHRMRSELEAMLGRPATKPLEFASQMNLTTELGRSWTDALQLVERQTRRSHNLLDHPLASKNIERILIEGLLLAQPHNYTEALDEAHRPALPATVRKAVDLIHAHPDEPWTTSELARRISVSSRVLQHGFQHHVGASPMRYLRNVRLDRVREDLKAADPGSTTVANIAAQWGFLYFGRFAAAYRERFGEPPSHTLRSPSG